MTYAVARNENIVEVDEDEQPESISNGEVEETLDGAETEPRTALREPDDDAWLYECSITAD
jgi:hypothetical protein